MKSIMKLVLSVLMLICFSGSAFAAYSLKLDGQPDELVPGESLGYFMWQDKDGLHLRTTAPGTVHTFSGVIRTNGRFGDITGKLTGPDDYFRINQDRSEITFTITTEKGEPGLDLSLNGGTYVKFDLSIDGAPADPQAIYIGRQGWHPSSHSFTLSHAGNKETDSHDRTIIIVDGGFWWGWSFPHSNRHPAPGPYPLKERHGYPY